MLIVLLLQPTQSQFFHFALHGPSAVPLSIAVDFDG